MITRHTPAGHLPSGSSEAVCHSDIALDFDQVYEHHVDFVCLAVRRLGVPDALVEDAAQDVFLVVHRRLADFAGPAPVRSWLYGIALRVARDYRRRLSRKGGLLPLEDDVRDVTPGPLEALARSEALHLLARLLARLDDDEREVFVMAELEQLTIPEIAALLGQNPNTLYSRLAAARASFEAALTRYRPRQP